MAFWAYILACADGKFYTGHTDDLERRLSEHQTGSHCDFTSRRLPVELVWSESFATRIEALKAERVVGGWSRAKKQALIAGNWSLVSHFAKPPHERSNVTYRSPFVSSEVEKHGAALGACFSTTLETNGEEIIETREGGL
ncbi:excinuclease ABC subunit C [Sphingomonas sp. Leaf357]|uniref:GIY-YIG nuclease family protein n=1 Tax=Sphingomonas sp. Leaf357 TaxID=1736350 RepID=UPI0006F3CE51|nr:GIY-YIG nuclease family protein [Sphingomonas sp. Leaf357]KQS04651.1 excinuclease ABC subunit C [Sphingomonas sp. Leaf357]